MARVNTNSSPGFDPFPTLFIKRAETEFMVRQGKAQRANVLLQLLTDLFKLLRKKITPIHKKAEPSPPQNCRLIAINKCMYRLCANVVRLTDWMGVG